MQRLTIAIVILMMQSCLARADPPGDPVVRALTEQARSLKPLASTSLARQFLAATAALPTPPTRILFFDPKTGLSHDEPEVPSLPDSMQARLQPQSYDGQYYYQTRYGTPLSYLRPIELVAQAGLTSLEGKRVLDFGYGRIGPLRLLACLGAKVVGVDVDPMLPALYSRPEDQGAVPGHGGPDGSLRLVHGSFPADAAVRAAVGNAYDLVLSKNTLKGGHEPHERAAQSRIVDLGVSDTVFVQAVHACLNPGGWFLMYNLSSPQGNGHCPFPETLLRAAGFDVVAYDADDSPAARAARRALNPDPSHTSTDESEMVIGTYTLVRKTGDSR